MVISVNPIKHITFKAEAASAPTPSTPVSSPAPTTAPVAVPAVAVAPVMAPITPSAAPSIATLALNPQVAEPSKTTPKGVIAKAGYGWVNTVEASKGIVKGLWYGFLTGTVVAGLSCIRSGLKKYKNKEIKFLEMFNPKKAMSTTGRVMSYVAAGLVLVGNMVLAKLRANQRSANVDHMLYDGHRS